LKRIASSFLKEFKVTALCSAEKEMIKNKNP
jgi:hypothetical protein